eukprot:TRINITY_DN13740_c0_g1_i4.p3 TRINITY_DN13740_c0_g1~~TRINITY_DN13740_c0_g1_i4.p3  ORF type:complete len:137 (-),score=21.74 TRINITY_DN13740_c0_g1_i4:675-1085(-)
MELIPLHVGPTCYPKERRDILSDDLDAQPLELGSGATCIRVAGVGDNICIFGESTFKNVECSAGAMAESRGVEAVTAPSGDVGTAISESANVGQASSRVPELENVKPAIVGMANVREKKCSTDGDIAAGARKREAC